MPEVLDITLGETVRIVHRGFPQLLMADPESVGFKDRPVKFVPASDAARQAPLRLQWAGRVHVVAYQGDAYIPFDCAKLYFGDPRSGAMVSRVQDRHGVDMIIPDRLAEVQRLRYLWQETNVRFREFIPGDRSLLDEPISDRIPDVEIYALTGDRIYTVVDDPHGDRIIAATPSIAQDQARDFQLLQQSDMILQLQRERDALYRKLGIRPEDLELDPETPVDGAKQRKHPGQAQAPVEAAVKENPAMVYDQRARQVRPKPEKRSADPDRLEEIPVDGG